VELRGVDRCLAARAEQLDPELGRRRAAEAEVGAGHGGIQIEHVDRLLHGARVVARGARILTAALELAGQHHGIGLAVALEPVAGEPVAEPAVVLCQACVGALAQ